MPAQEEEEEHGCINCSIKCGKEKLEWFFEKKDEYCKNNDVKYRYGKPGLSTMDITDAAAIGIGIIKTIDNSINNTCSLILIIMIIMVLVNQKQELE